MKTRYLSFYYLFAFCVFFNSACTTKTNKKEELRIFAAASLGDVTKAMIDSFQVRYDCRVKTNIASSGTLARQIAQGAEADIFISANQLWANYLDSLGYIKNGLKIHLAKNELVLISNNSFNINQISIDSSLNIKSLIGQNRIAIGNPMHVPVGQYAQQAMNYYGWGSVLKSNLITATDARSTLKLVEMGEIAFGIVYRSDALSSDKVKIIGSFPSLSHEEIVYVACALNEYNITKAFISFAQSQVGQAICLKQGFKP